MGAYTDAPWFAERSEEAIVIRGPDGDSICAMRRITGDRSAEEQDANAALIALAPELFRSVRELISVMRRSDVESSDGKSCSGEEWDTALEDAQSLLDLLAEEGVQLGEDWTVDESHPANQVTSAPAIIFYPAGSLGELVEA